MVGKCGDLIGRNFAGNNLHFLLVKDDAVNQWITRLKAPVRLPVFGEPHWRGDSKELFYFSTQQNSMMAVNVEEKGGEISLGAPRTLFPLSSPYATFISFEVTPNGKRFLILTVNFPTASIPITLVTNWEAELKKK